MSQQPVLQSKPANRRGAGGFALELAVRPGTSRVLATGAWLKNTGCMLVDARAGMSDVHGDLGTATACEALELTLDEWLRNGCAPDAIAHDLHPDFHSTRLAQEVAGRLGIPAVAVQHHHAHIAAVAAEHQLDGPLLGLALDGVGLGADGQLWGGELLALDGAGYERLAHLAPIRLAGGDRAAREPWRLLLALALPLGSGAAAFGIAQTQQALVIQMLERRLNCPESTAAGRWFDAAAAALGLCYIQDAEAQAAIALERAASQWLAESGGPAGAASLELASAERDALAQSLDMSVLVRLMAGHAEGATATVIGREAARFHLVLADALAARTIIAARQTGITDVALGGGCWFNRILSQRTSARLADAGLQVYRPERVSPGDAGLSLGQAWVVRRLLETH